MALVASSGAPKGAVNEPLRLSKKPQKEPQRQEATKMRIKKTVVSPLITTAYNVGVTGFKPATSWVPNQCYPGFPEEREYRETGK